MASAFAAYITGNVASNLIGRLVSAGVADHFGLAANFYFFAVLNLLGALLVYFTVEKTPPMRATVPGMGSHFSAWIMHLKNPPLRASFAIGFCILFAFIGTFTYVNFVLVQPPFSVDAMTLGIIYFVFLPSIATTPLAGRAVERFGTREQLRGCMPCSFDFSCVFCSRVPKRCHGAPRERRRDDRRQEHEVDEAELHHADRQRRPTSTKLTNVKVPMKANRMQKPMPKPARKRRIAKMHRSSRKRRAHAWRPVARIGGMRSTREIDEHGASRFSAAKR